MAKSMRSKIKRRFRTELRQRIGVPLQAIQEAKIQDNLVKAIESQTSGKSMLGLKQLMGSAATPVAVNPNEGMEIDQTPDLSEKDKKKLLKSKLKKPAQKRKKNLQFHVLRKKGVFSAGKN